MARPRDNQRSRVYAWERVACQATLDRSLYTSEFTTLEECEAFLKPIWRAERGRVGLARQVAPELARNLWGQRRATAGADHRLKLPRWARSRWVILHEAAHRLTPHDEAHGPRFVGVLIGLLARHCGIDANRLMALADQRGVRYHVRSIGSVPIFTPSAQVEHAVSRHGPMTSMDIACHLSLADGVDITERQVRGAALALIRAGRARWLRHKLTLLDTEKVASNADGCRP